MVVARRMNKKIHMMNDNRMGSMVSSRYTTTTGMMPPTETHVRDLLRRMRATMMTMIARIRMNAIRYTSTVGDMSVYFLVCSPSHSLHTRRGTLHIILQSCFTIESNRILIVLVVMRMKMMPKAT